MLALLAVALLFIDLGPTFENASAFGDARGDSQLFVDIQVEVVGDFTTVVAHFIDPGDEQQTVALARRGDGRFYGGQAVVERANLVVVFEGIRRDSTSELSEPADLISLGVDPDAIGSVGGVPPPEEDQSTPAWVWLALAVVAAVLSGLALWAMRDYEPEQEDTEEAEEDSAPATDPAVADAGTDAGAADTSD